MLVTPFSMSVNPVNYYICQTKVVQTRICRIVLKYSTRLSILSYIPPLILLILTDSMQTNLVRALM